MRIPDALGNLVFGAAMATQGRATAMRLLRSARDPAGAQRRLLTSIIHGATDTAFGREHGYCDLADPDGFRARVPIGDYEAHRPWIDRQIAGESSVTMETPVMYARTSGTTGEPKRVPITPSVLAGLRAAQRAASYFQHRACPMFRGRVLALGGAMREETLPGGVPCGSVTGLIYATMPAVVRAKYVVPPEVFAIEDADLKYAVVTRLALQHADMTAVSTANPSTFLRLRDHVRAHWSELVAELETGAFAAADALPPEQASAVRAALIPSPERARALRAAADIAEPTVGQLWPKLAGVVTWTGGSCGLAADAVRQALEPTVRMIEAGYVASEFRGTVIADVDRSLGLPLLDDVFFEFVPVEAWDAGRRDTLLLHEIEEGAEYQVIVTTRAGLARYWINDVVRAGPPIGRTPSLSFVRKGRGVTSITGEKLTEAQVTAALQGVGARHGLVVAFHMALADEQAATYQIFVEAEGRADGEAVGQALDEALGEGNIEYASKRASQRLCSPQLRRLEPGAGAAYRRWCVSRGQRDAQFKALTLQYARECAFDFTPWLSEDK